MFAAQQPVKQCTVMLTRRRRDIIALRISDIRGIQALLVLLSVCFPMAEPRRRNYKKKEKEAGK